MGITGPEVVCITFGSMVHGGADGVLAACVSAVLSAGLRVCVISGGGVERTVTELSAEFPSLAPSILHVTASAPHSWLFPRCKFVIHHGGAGTTARALASGKPSLIIPVLRWSDQSLWGELVELCGVGIFLRDSLSGGGGVGYMRDSVRAAVSRLLHSLPFSAVAVDTASSGGVGEYDATPFSPQGSSLTGAKYNNNEGNSSNTVDLLPCPPQSAAPAPLYQPFMDKSNRTGASIRAERSCAPVLTLFTCCLCKLILPLDSANKVRALIAELTAAVGVLPPVGRGDVGTQLRALTSVERMCFRHCVACNVARRNADRFGAAVVCKMGPSSLPTQSRGKKNPNLENSASRQRGIVNGQAFSSPQPGVRPRVKAPPSPPPAFLSPSNPSPRRARAGSRRH